MRKKAEFEELHTCQIHTRFRCVYINCFLNEKESAKKKMNFFMVLAVTLGECRVWNGLPFGGDMPIAYDKVIFS